VNGFGLEGIIPEDCVREEHGPKRGRNVHTHRSKNGLYGDRAGSPDSESPPRGPGTLLRTGRGLPSPELISKAASSSSEAFKRLTPSVFSSVMLKMKVSIIHLVPRHQSLVYVLWPTARRLPWTRNAFREARTNDSTECKFSPVLRNPAEMELSQPGFCRAGLRSARHLNRPLTCIIDFD
jgi:hypothetical protein